MMPSYSAYSPGHITAFFAIHMGKTPSASGSTGAGLCVEGGVATTVTVEPSERMALRVTCNGSAFSSPTCASLFQRIASGDRPMAATATQETIFPANFGYGISGASALSLGMALNRAMGLGLSAEQVGLHAHVAEVENMTGLGDVSAELAGGVEMRDVPGGPGIGRVTRLAGGEGMAVISTPVRSFPTRTMITEREYVSRINLHGTDALAAFSADTTLHNLMIISRRFWEAVGLITGEMMDVVRLYERAGVESPSAKKGLVFGVVPLEEAHRVAASIIGTERTPSGQALPAKLTDPRTGRVLIISRISAGGAS